MPDQSENTTSTKRISALEDKIVQTQNTIDQLRSAGHRCPEAEQHLLKMKAGLERESK